MICFSGRSRSSDTIIRQQSERLIAGSADALEAMHQLRHDAVAMKQAVLQGNMDSLAAVLERSWLAKKRTAAAVSTPQIDALEGLARRNGATAAKVSGAGGGGFMMFVVPSERRYRLVAALNDAGGQAYAVKLTDRGSESWILPVRRTQDQEALPAGPKPGDSRPLDPSGGPCRPGRGRWLGDRARDQRTPSPSHRPRPGRHATPHRHGTNERVPRAMPLAWVQGAAPPGLAFPGRDIRRLL